MKSMKKLLLFILTALALVGLTDTDPIIVKPQNDPWITTHSGGIQLYVDYPDFKGLFDDKKTKGRLFRKDN